MLIIIGDIIRYRRVRMVAASNIIKSATERKIVRRVKTKATFVPRRNFEVATTTSLPAKGEPAFMGRKNAIAS